MWSQYQTHVLHIEDENYFEPLEIRSGDDMSSRYEQNLTTIFNLDKISSTQFYFFIKPSFEPENLLIIERKPDRYTLTYTRLTKNYWQVFYYDNSVIAVEKTTSIAELRRATGDKIFALLDRVILQARSPRAKSITLDGIVYSLIKKAGEGQKIVYKHSPGAGSGSAKSFLF